MNIVETEIRKFAEKEACEIYSENKEVEVALDSLEERLTEFATPKGFSVELVSSPSSMLLGGPTDRLGDLGYGLLVVERS